MTIPRLAFAVVIGTALPAAAQDGSTDLELILLEAESDATLLQNGYVAEAGRQATKLDTPIAEIPQSIDVVTQDQIEDQAPRQLLEALSYSSGTSTTNFAFDSRYDAFYLRGFSAFNTGLFRDSLRQVNGPSAWYRNDPYTREGVAILKGPASSLYGVSGPGGIVNLVSKRPKEGPFNELRFGTGTDDRAEFAFDFTGPATEDGRLLYRFTGLAREANTTLPGYHDDKLLVAPAITYESGERTRITVLGEYSDSTAGGTAIPYNPEPGVASDTYAGDPDYNDFPQDQWRLDYEIEHELTDAITLRQQLRYSEVDSDLQYSGLFDNGDGTPGRYWGHYLETQRNVVADNAGEFAFDTGGFSHRLVAGLDYSRASYDASLAQSIVSIADIEAIDAPYFEGQKFEQTGIYLHDQISNGSLNLFVSGRYDWVDLTTFDAMGVGMDTSDEEFSGRIGVSYALANGFTPFANLSNAFVPNTGTVYDDPSDPASGRPSNATTALQKEIGLKYQLPGTESLITAALFDIEQDDGVVLQVLDLDDFDDFGGLNQVQVPYDLHSRGLELEPKPTSRTACG